METREKLDAQIVLQVTRRTKTHVGLIRDAYGMSSEAAVIRAALAQGRTLAQLAEAVGLDLP